MKETDTGNVESGLLASNGIASLKAGRTWSKWGENIVKHWPEYSKLVAVLYILAMIWGILHFLDIENVDQHTGLFALLFGAKISGIIVSLVGIPDILGMFFFGVLFKYVGWADFSGIVSMESFLKELAFVNLLLLVGLGLNYKELKKIMARSLLLGFIPTIAEVAIITVLAHFLWKMPWLWGNIYNKTNNVPASTTEQIVSSILFVRLGQIIKT